MKFSNALTASSLFLALPSQVASHSFADSVKILLQGAQTVNEGSGARCRPNLGDVYDCPRGEYCAADVGICYSADYEGTCTPMGSACPSNWEPVCGCDGKTYGNECEAAGAYVSIQYSGECSNTACNYGKYECYANEYCSIPDGACSASPGEIYGSCELKPTSCTFDNNPVCGCDGLTYANACEANANGKSVAYTGECENAVCVYGDSYTCYANEWCSIPAGVCTNTGSIVGSCEMKPNGCTADWTPVCGYFKLIHLMFCPRVTYKLGDARTYGNECEANGAGVNVWYEGECMGEDEAVSTDGDEDANE